jgi:hypothetical protein
MCEKRIKGDPVFDDYVEYNPKTTKFRIGAM